MKLVADFSVTSAPARSQAGWHPGYLFRGGVLGAWYDFSDPAKLFQDEAASVPVAADGDPVAVALDLSGNGNHAVQSALSARPTWRTDGTLSWIEFDGVDDHMVIPPIAYSSPFSLSLGLQRYPGSSWGGFRSPLSIPPYVNTGASHPTDGGTITNTAGGTDRIDGQPSGYTRIGLYNALQSPRVASAVDNTSSSLNAEGTFFCYGQLRPSGRVFAYAEVEGVSLADIIRLERWIGEKTGVTL